MLLFLYNNFGDIMVIYLDVLFLLNLLIDLMLLITVKYILKRKTKIKRLLLSSLCGAFSIFLLLIPLNNFNLFIYKLIIGVFMILIAFGFRSWRYFLKNMSYLYMVSTIFAGAVYFINTSFSYEFKGLVASKNGLNVNLYLIILIMPLFLYLYIKQSRELKNNYNYYYDVELFLYGEKFNLIGFLDTGNKLKDPITNKAIVLVNREIIKSAIHNRSPMYVPIKTVNKNSLIKCYKPSQFLIKNHPFNNILIGTIEENIKIDGVECLLNYRMMEEINA